MFGQDENEEDVVLKVIDRRKFNSDGSVKDGVTLEPAPAPKQVEPKPIAAPIASPRRP